MSKDRQNNREVIHIFHDTGSPHHYRALTDCAKNKGDIKIIFREFSVLKLLIKGIYNLDLRKVLKQVKNLFFITGLIFTRNRKVIIGIAPYDWRLIMYYPLLLKHTYYYHTSATNWDYNGVPKQFMAGNSGLQNIWYKFVNNASGIFCVSQKTAKELKKKYQVDHLSVVNHAIPSSYESRSFILKTNQKIKCLFVGRFEKSKGINLIFKLIRKLNEDHFTFTFVGSGSLYEEINNLAEKRKNCRILGRVNNPELRNVYDDHDILLLPSLKTGTWEELFGMVIIEGMSRGVVPMTTNHSGPREILQDNFPNFLFQENNYVPNVREKLKQLYNDRSTLKSLQKIAFEIGQGYNPNKIFKNWNQLLKISD